MSTLQVTAIASWFGSNRMCAARVGQELRGCECVGVVFAGGLSELPHIKARTLLVNDVHRHLINLARVAGDKKLGPALYRKLRRTPYHPDALEAAQERCRLRDAAASNGLFHSTSEMELTDALEWAYDYFLCSWMIRHATAGTPNEFNGSIAMRYDAGGGDNGVHFRNATTSLVAWRRDVLWRCNFTTLDFREFLRKCCKDKKSHGIYSDSPFPDAGDGYKHSFSMKDHRDLATQLAEYKDSRVVCRFHDHPLIRELYPESKWTWIHFAGRKQTNEAAAEILLINGESQTKVGVRA